MEYSRHFPRCRAVIRGSPRHYGMKIMTKKKFHLWSAMPTPLLPDYEIDLDSLARCIQWQHGLGIEGLFVAGTCGEGAFLRDAQIDLLTRKSVELSSGRMPVTVQVTDNSAGRILDRIRRAKDNGADLATVAPPRFERFCTTRTLGRLYREVIEQSPLPLCIYQLPFKTVIPLELVPELYVHPNLRMIKDSTGDAERQEIVFATARRNPELLVLTGIEIGYYADFIRGFDGGLLGTAILNAAWARAMHDAVKDGDHEQARAISARIGDFLLEIFGGTGVPGWMGGLKYCLRRMGIFSHETSHMDMPADDVAMRRIDRLIDEEFWKFTPEALPQQA